MTIDEFLIGKSLITHPNPTTVITVDPNSVANEAQLSKSGGSRPSISTIHLTDICESSQLIAALKALPKPMMDSYFNTEIFSRAWFYQNKTTDGSTYWRYIQDYAGTQSSVMIDSVGPAAIDQIFTGLMLISNKATGLGFWDGTVSWDVIASANTPLLGPSALPSLNDGTIYDLSIGRSVLAQDSFSATITRQTQKRVSCAGKTTNGWPGDLSHWYGNGQPGGTVHALKFTSKVMAPFDSLNPQATTKFSLQWPTIVANMSAASLASGNSYNALTGHAFANITNRLRNTYHFNPTAKSVITSSFNLDPVSDTIDLSQVASANRIQFTATWKKVEGYELVNKRSYLNVRATYFDEASQSLNYVCSWTPPEVVSRVSYQSEYQALLNAPDQRNSSTPSLIKAAIPSGRARMANVGDSSLVDLDKGFTW